MTSSANFAGASQLLSSIQSWQTIQEWGQHSVWLVPGCTQKLLYTWHPPTQVREYTIATVHLTPTYSGQRVHRNYCTRDTRLLMSESTQKLYLTLLYSWSDSTQKLHLNLFVLFYLFLKMWSDCLVGAGSICTPSSRPTSTTAPSHQTQTRSRCTVHRLHCM